MASGGQSGDGCALPKKMQQRPGQRGHQIGGRAHGSFLSYSSSMRRISSISFFEPRRPESTCCISWLAEPRNTRCSTSAANLLFGLLRWLRCLVHVRALVLGTRDQTLGGHDLQLLQRARVTDVLLLREHVVDLAHRRRPAAPEDVQDFQLGRSGLELGCSSSCANATTILFVLSTMLFVGGEPTRADRAGGVSRIRTTVPRAGLPESLKSGRSMP